MLDNTVADARVIRYTRHDAAVAYLLRYAYERAPLLIRC